MNIGITGKFLSGKTTFSKLLAEELAWDLFSCDAYVEELYKINSVRKIIIDTFGENVYKDNSIQKKVLSGIVFDSKENLEKLESIIIPLVEAEIKKRINYNSKTVFEIPLLYEKQLQHLMDVCILMVCSAKTCMTRTKLRNFSEEDYLKRSSRFLSDEEKENLGALVVVNEGSLEKLKSEAKRIAGLIRGL
ncbi:MAG: hypothetical protein ACD_79C00483G0002 [uncultured bacterium]|nr:MAG: hypothetical protein ACD_79C00483G0002 [uncultured bacterium]